MLVHRNHFALELLDRDLITPEKHKTLLADISQNKLNSVLDFLPYCKQATVIDIKKIEDSTNKDAELVEEILKQISSIDTNLRFTNFQGSFGEDYGYGCMEGFSIEHQNKKYYGCPITADEIPYTLNSLLADHHTEYRIVVVYNEFSPRDTVDLNEDYRKFGVILMKEEQLKGLYYCSQETKVFSALSFPAIQQVYDAPLPDSTWYAYAVPPGNNYFNLKEALKNPEDVENLYLQGNEIPLTELGPEIQQFDNLRTLHLANNQLTTLPPEIGSLTQLRKIDLSGNKISGLPKQMANLVNLEELNLSGNGLYVLPPEIFSLTNLKDLDLNHNKLESMPSELGSLTDLRVLNLWHNKLTTLPRTVKNLQKLHYINLDHNKIYRLPVEFYALKSLKRAILSDNDIHHIDPAINQLSNLQDLILRDNHIEQLPEEIGDLHLLIHLDVGKNHLSSLPVNINKLTRLKYLSYEPNPYLIPEERERTETWIKKQEERLYWCRELILKN
ncbi:MAG: leucine-rich repeat domain-containing protein [Flavobacteriales bacterium]|nr:leucine-rich repeat domain-containing protein [Flavobacteriales bacterium]